MISTGQIETWAASGESETLEFKRSTGKRRQAARTLCAMLNHRGGRVLLGIERVGTTNQALSRDEYNRMLLERLHADSRWENQPAPDWAVADPDEEEIRRTLEEAIRTGRIEDPGTRDPAAILRGLGLMKQDALKRAAVVLFGRRERLPAEFPGWR